MKRNKKKVILVTFALFIVFVTIEYLEIKKINDDAKADGHSVAYAFANPFTK